MKSFIKPNILKIVFFTILITLSLIIPFDSILGSSINNWPIINYKTIQCRSLPGTYELELVCTPSISILYIVFNLILYYILSCIVFIIIKKLK